MGLETLITDSLTNPSWMTLAVLIFLIACLAIWSIVWKGLALWKSARRSSLAWFIVLLILNTAGILEILYIFIFSEMGKKKSRKKSKRR